MATQTANDIFTTSWKASPPPPPLPPATLAIHAGLGRSKTTGSSWRGKARSALEPNMYNPPPLEDLTPRAGAESLPLLVIPSDQSSNTTGKKREATRTSSFFDLSSRYFSPAMGISPGIVSPYDPPLSPALSTSTATLSHASTHSSNPSLSATLPSPLEAGSISAASINDPATDVELRFFPVSDLRLGVGRYSRVYLAGYRRGKAVRAQPFLNDQDDEGGAWKLCAVKKLDEDEESQRLGLREAWFLRQLASGGKAAYGVGQDQGSAEAEHPGKARVIRLLGLRREDDVSIGAVHKPRLSWPQSTLLHQALDGRKSHLRHSRHSSTESDIPPIRIPSANLQPFHAFSQPPDKHLLLVLPFAPGVLSDIIHTKPHLVTRQRHTRIALQLAQATSYIHSQSILHTDIKPHNILITSTFDVLLSDFNTAIHLPSASLNGLPDDAAGLGTPVYSPPEFNRPRPSPFSYPVDIWALGVSLMVAMVGREPYARLMNGKGRKGNGRQELKMWLGKGAYWQWEEQERMDLLDDQEPSLSSVNSPADVSADDHSRIGVPQLRKVLNIPNPSLQLLELGEANTNPEAHGRRSLNEDVEAQYDDGTGALHYLGGTPKTRMSQRMFSLLRSMCSPAPSRRPEADEIVSVLEQELREMEEW